MDRRRVRGRRQALNADEYKPPAGLTRSGINRRQSFLDPVGIVVRIMKTTLFYNLKKHFYSIIVRREEDELILSFDYCLTNYICQISK